MRPRAGRRRPRAERRRKMAGDALITPVNATSRCFQNVDVDVLEVVRAGASDLDGGHLQPPVGVHRYPPMVMCGSAHTPSTWSDPRSALPDTSPSTPDTYPVGEGGGGVHDVEIETAVPGVVPAVFTPATGIDLARRRRMTATMSHRQATNAAQRHQQPRAHDGHDEQAEPRAVPPRTGNRPRESPRPPRRQGSAGSLAVRVQVSDEATLNRVGPVRRTAQAIRLPPRRRS